MKPTFLNQDRPLFTVMIQRFTPDEAFDTIKKAIPEGADAFGIQFECFGKEYRNKETYKKLFSATEGRPVYVTNYRHNNNEGKTDEELAEGLVELAECGATLIDIMGDMFCRHPQELTDDPEAIKKQMELIDRLHAKGAEVLMSSHVLKYTEPERVLEIAKAQEARGADICKIVTYANDDIEQGENLKMIAMLKKELKIPFLYLCGGNCRVLRRIGPMLGCTMWLCVQEHHELSTKTQPVLKNVRAVWENFRDYE